jgi:hypothetical protein
LFYVARARAPSPATSGLQPTGLQRADLFSLLN